MSNSDLLSLAAFLVSVVAFFLNRHHAEKLFRQSKYPDLDISYPLQTYGVAGTHGTRTMFGLRLANMSSETPVKDLQVVVSFGLWSRWLRRIRRPVNLQINRGSWDDDLMPLAQAGFTLFEGSDKAVELFLAAHFPEVIGPSTTPNIFPVVSKRPIVMHIHIEYRAGLLGAPMRILDQLYVLEAVPNSLNNNSLDGWKRIQTIELLKWKR